LNKPKKRTAFTIHAPRDSRPWPDMRSTCICVGRHWPDILAGLIGADLEFPLAEKAHRHTIGRGVIAI
jgi:hypothetical protein